MVAKFELFGSFDVAGPLELIGYFEPGNLNRLGHLIWFGRLNQ